MDSVCSFCDGNVWSSLWNIVAALLTSLTELTYTDTLPLCKTGRPQYYYKIDRARFQLQSCTCQSCGIFALEVSKTGRRIFWTGFHHVFWYHIAKSGNDCSHWYEILGVNGQANRLYFDLDVPREMHGISIFSHEVKLVRNTLVALVRFMANLFLNGEYDYTVLSMYGRDEKKHSMHILFPGLCFISPPLLKDFAVKCIDHWKMMVPTMSRLTSLVRCYGLDGIVDKSCYANVCAAQNFRIPFCHKFDSGRILMKYSLVSVGASDLTLSVEYNGVLVTKNNPF